MPLTRTDFFSGNQNMLSKLFIRKRGGPRLSPQAQALLRLSDINMSSANCTLIQASDGSTQREDMGRVDFFKSDGRLLIQQRSLFITTPDGLKAENRDRFKGNGEILSLWFLHERIPRVVECRVEERIKLDDETLQKMDPKVGIGYRLAPVSDILKQDKRSSLRFSHQAGQGALPVYPQILFDLYLYRTDQSYPVEGALVPWIEELGVILPDEKNGRVEDERMNLESLVETFKQGMRANPADDRNVHVSKPFMEEKFNRSVLVELGFSDVLGLGSQDVARNLHIKKPMISRIKDRRDPNYLTVGDILILHYGTRGGLDGHSDYFELITEITKGGLENLTIRPMGNPREEHGLRMTLLDFCVNGIRFQNSPEFMRYAIGKEFNRFPPEEQMQFLENQVFLMNFYPRLRFNRDSDGYRPILPKRISIPGKIVRSEIEWDDEEEEKEGQIRNFGIQFMYGPTEYSRDQYAFDKWEMIRPFKENRYFKEVHKSLNGLIAYLESQSKELIV